VADPGVPAALSEGVSVINADKWQASYNSSYNGTGVKIGIIDVGFGNLTEAINAGEIQGLAAVYWFIGNAGTDTHGTLCTEIIHDIAPQAQLYLANYGDKFRNL
jgi:subtilase family serine protease